MPAGRPSILTEDGQLLFEQRQVVGHLGAADGVLHDAQQHVVVRRGRGNAPAVPEPDQRLEGERARRGELVVAEAALREGEHQGIGAQVVAQQRQIAGEVRERREQRGHLGVLEVLADLVVRLGDGLHRADERAEGRRDLTHSLNVVASGLRQPTRTGNVRGPRT